MQNHYDIRTREIVLTPEASLYARFHELAHKKQHETRATAFMAWYYFHPIRLIGYFFVLWIEWDAYRRARTAMRQLGLWNKEACIEARKNLISYVVRQETT